MPGQRVQSLSVRDLREDRLHFISRLAAAEPVKHAGIRLRTGTYFPRCFAPRQVMNARLQRAANLGSPEALNGLGQRPEQASDVRFRAHDVNFARTSSVSSSSSVRTPT
jgi:hypothetical protein